MKKLITLLLTAALCIGSLVGCTGDVIDAIDPNKTQIYIEPFDGGCGIAWLQDLADNWNENSAYAEDYEVIVKKNLKKDTTEVATNLSVRSKNSPSIYFSVGSDFKSSINSDKLEDLSDLLEYKPDGDEGLTIGQKLNNFDEWREIAKKDSTNSGMYILPWNDCLSGFVYNHDDFLEKNWLIKATSADTADLDSQGFEYTKVGAEYICSTAKGNYEEGDVILSRGKDGKFGTYDDGQPVTETEWATMINKIKVTKAVPFNWTGQMAGTYLPYLYYTLMAQYSNKQTVVDFFNKDSDGREYDMVEYAKTGIVTVTGTTKKSFDVDTGYLSYSLKCVKDMIGFIKTYMYGEANLHPDTTKLTSHKGAQDHFVLGYKGEKTNPYSAMLWEGSWWENEAKTTLNNLDDSDRRFGKQDYRFMLLPNLVDDNYISGTAKTAMAISEASCFLVPKCSNAEKLSAIKDFLAFSLSDEALRAYTVSTGVIRPYKYTLTNEDYAKMTPFARNAWELYNDSENICLIRSAVLKNMPLSYAATGYKEYSIGNHSSITDALVAASGTSEEKINAVAYTFANTYTTSTWATLISKARQNGYYTK